MAQGLDTFCTAKWQSWGSNLGNMALGTKLFTAFSLCL